MVLAHSLIGIPITYFLIKNKKEMLDNKAYEKILYFVGIFGAVFPDFDLVLSFFIEDLDHRKLISHSLIPYLLLFLFFYILFKKFNFRNSALLLNMNLVFFIGVLSHLLLDLLIGGIVLFSPFTNKLYGFDIYFGDPENFFQIYFSSFYLIPEIILIMLSSYFFYKLRHIKTVYLSWIFLISAVIMIFNN